MLGIRKSRAPNSSTGAVVGHDGRDQLGVRALASSMLGLLVFALLSDATTNSGPGGFLIVLFGSIVGLPFAIGVATIAFWFAPHILRHPILWSVGVWALVNTVWVGFFARDMAGFVVGASSAAAVIFYTWGLKPFRQSR